MRTTKEEREEIISQNEINLAEKWRSEDNLTRIGVLLSVPIAWGVIIMIILGVIMSIGHTLDNLDKITERWEFGQYIFVLFVAIVVFCSGVAAGWRMRDSDYKIDGWF